MSRNSGCVSSSRQTVLMPSIVRGLFAADARAARAESLTAPPPRCADAAAARSGIDNRTISFLRITSPGVGQAGFGTEARNTAVGLPRQNLRTGTRVAKWAFTHDLRRVHPASLSGTLGLLPSVIAAGGLAAGGLVANLRVC